MKNMCTVTTMGFSVKFSNIDTANGKQLLAQRPLVATVFDLATWYETNFGHPSSTHPTEKGNQMELDLIFLRRGLPCGYPTTHMTPLTHTTTYQPDPKHITHFPDGLRLPLSALH